MIPAMRFLVSIEYTENCIKKQDLTAEMMVPLLVCI